MEIARWRDPAFETALLGSVDPTVPWSVVERLSTVVRECGTSGEREAVDYLAERLAEWGIPHRLHEPVCLISLPRAARLRVVSPAPEEFRAKATSFSTLTGDGWIEGEVLHVATGFARDMAQVFGPGETAPAAARGRIVLTEGLPMPGKVYDFMRAGAVAVVLVSPGERIHEGIATTIWGTPDLDTVDRKPTIPVLTVARSTGERLAELARNGSLRIAVQTRLEESWRPIPVLVAEVPGTEAPEELALAHGHVDSWHFGVGDNAVGDAALLELARVFWSHRARLRRTLRVAWWSGHSHGRYAGSTWYADTFAPELAEWAIAHVNCDSPGCRGATGFEDVDWMPEAERVAAGAIEDVAGVAATGRPPIRAGDYSFNNLGVTGFYMLTSNMPAAERDRQGLYAVGGCGGNLAWHAEDDSLEIADRANLARDIRVYATALARVLNAPVHPFDYRRTVDLILATLGAYGRVSGGRLDLEAPAAEAASLSGELDAFYSSAEGLATRPASDPAVRRANRIQRAVARELVPVLFSRRGRFQHDPALGVPLLPDLAEVGRLGAAAPGSDDDHILSAHLLRGRNRVTWALRQARRAIAGEPGGERPVASGL